MTMELSPRNSVRLVRAVARIRRAHTRTTDLRTALAIACTAAEAVDDLVTPGTADRIATGIYSALCANPPNRDLASVLGDVLWAELAKWCEIPMTEWTPEERVVIDHLRVARTHLVELRAWLSAMTAPTPAEIERPVSTSLRFAVWAARVLPVGSRDQYREIFESELHELAASGCSWWAQVACAVRVLVRAPALRRALKAKAAPVGERRW
ncbi:hypothetical protein LV79_004326 [Actinokineospora globicatena]|nr:hypothetical protein [Actinokineospora globicatena]GLW78009.1 hypothetical protein Aglo01_24910 [Actinokineospora globicatena]GLW85325.1 hypothetical protein Aglo02_29650 [Actinokineospora globicatena]